jgi:hypothetical protein
MMGAIRGAHTMRFRTALCLLAILAAPVCAQQVRLDERLPASTTFYVYWHGTGSYQAVQSSNPLLRLWNDPEFAPTRNAMMQWVDRQRVEMKLPASVTRETIFSLMENPFVLGSFTPPKTTTNKTEASKGQTNPANQDDFFLIYDATGKQALVESLLKLESSDPKEAETVTRFKLRGIDVEAVKGAKSTHYQALTGTFFIIADRKEAMEDLLLRYVGKGAAGPEMRSAADYQEARRGLGEHATLELVLHMGDLMQSAMAQAKGAEAEAVNAVGLTRLRLLVCGIVFERDATRVHATILGDMGPGSIFDLLGKNAAEFSTASVAPADSANFSAMWIDFPGIYRFFVQLMRKQMQPGQDPTAALDAAATQLFGMRVEEVLQLFTGEFAGFSPSVGLDPLGNVFAIGIRKPQEVLRVLRVALSKEIQSEDFLGGTSILSITSPFPDSKTGATRRQFLYVGVTPTMILVAPRKAMLKAMLVNGSKPGDAMYLGLAGNAKFTGARAQLPPSLSGLAYLDFSRVNWDDLVKEVTPPSNKDSNSKAIDAGDPAAWKSAFKSELLSKYLHLMISGWWKERGGIHFDGFIE